MLLLTAALQCSPREPKVSVFPKLLRQFRYFFPPPSLAPALHVRPMVHDPRGVSALEMQQHPPLTSTPGWGSSLPIGVWFVVCPFFRSVSRLCGKRVWIHFLSWARNHRRYFAFTSAQDSEGDCVCVCVGVFFLLCVCVYLDVTIFGSSPLIGLLWCCQAGLQRRWQHVLCESASLTR